MKQQQTLWALWSSRQKVHAARAELIRSFLYFTLNSGIVFGIANTLITFFSMAAQLTPPTAGILWVLGDTVLLAAVLFLKSLVERSFKQAILPSRLGDSVSGFEELIPLELKIRNLANKMLGSRRIEIRIDRVNTSISPSTIDIGGVTYISLPLGYFKLEKSRPCAADAMIAHELGHAAQKDTNLWLYSSLFTRYLSKGLFLVLVCRAMYFSATALLFGDKGDLFTQLPHIAWLTPLLFILIWETVRHLRTRSEEMADVAAMIYSSTGGIKEAILLTAGSSNEPLSIHPPSAVRLRNVERLERLPIGLPDAGVVPVPGNGSSAAMVKRGLNYILAALILFKSRLLLNIMVMTPNDVAQHLDHSPNFAFNLFFFFMNVIIGICIITGSVLVVCGLLGAKAPVHTD